MVVGNIDWRSERVIPFSLGDDKTIGNYIWAPDETHMVFSTFLHDAEGGLISMDYLILNVEAGTVIPFRENDAEYLNVRLITDATVAVGETVYSLEDGSVVEP